MEILVAKFLVPAALSLVCAGIMLAARGIALRFFSRWAKKTVTTVDDAVVSSLRGPSIFWAIALGIYLGILYSGIPELYANSLSRIIYVILIFSVTLALANLSGSIFKVLIRQANLPLPTTGLAYALVKGLILTLGILMILGVLGISIAPLLTALGVGGLAVALALQDTLANLFAGIHIMVEESLRVGDFIKLESGQEGYVDDISWRTTRVRMLPNNMVVIPNSKLAQSVVVNYYLPEKRMSLLIPIGVSYNSDPDKVEKILIDVAKDAGLPGLLHDPAPFVRFIPGFGDSALEFTLICQVAEFVDQYAVQHELRKMILRRFREEGIDIPFPHRTVYLREEKDWKR